MTSLKTAPPNIHLLYRSWNRALLFLACALPSLGATLKFGKLFGTLLYLLLAAAWIGVALPQLVRRASVLPRLERLAPRLAAAVLLLFTVLFLIIYPLSHSGRFGKGSDRADALNVSIPRLLEGKNPYTVRTYLGNPVTPLPGALLLGAPFRELLRDAAYQNIFWVFMLFVLLSSVCRTRVEAFLVWVTFLFMCPALLLDVMTGGDFTVNAIYCAASTLWLLRALARPPDRSDRWRVPVLAAFWGVCLCSRPSYGVLVPFVAAYALQRHGFRALGGVGLALGVVAALVLPIYLPAPQDFSPLHIGGKLTATGRVTPALLGGAAGFALLLCGAAWAGRHRGIGFTFAAGAIFLALPVPLVILADSHRAGHLSLANLVFALSPALFAVFAMLLPGGQGEPALAIVPDER